MFTGFNLTIENTFFENFQHYKTIGESHLAKYKTNCKEQLETYILGDNTIKGSELENDWFPKINADIFISHSHKDEDLALALAGWLNKTFNLTCFIDSVVWGYSGELIKSLNDQYNNKRQNSNGGVLYDHEKSIEITQHVDMMLSISLQKMIDKSEAIFLLNTENSVTKLNSSNKTYSPWIYAEIVCSEIVRKKSLLVYRHEKELKHSLYESVQNGAFKVTYDIHLEHLNDINSEKLRGWKNMYALKKYTYPLDILYKLLDIEQVKKLNFLTNPNVLLEQQGQ